MRQTSEAYRRTIPGHAVSGCVPVLPVERADEAAARMLGIGPDRAKKLRLGLIAQSITSILTACRNDPEKRENFRRAVLDAAAETAQPVLSPSLLLACQEADSAEDVAEVAYLSEPSEANRENLARKIERDIALSTDRLRALRSA